MDCYQKFEQEALPVYGPKWFNTLSEKFDVSKSDLAVAQEVWIKLECQNMGDYHNVYLKSNLLLLSDVFESFRNGFKQK